jgi:hypothetical protein
MLPEICVMHIKMRCASTVTVVGLGIFEPSKLPPFTFGNSPWTLRLPPLQRTSSICCLKFSCDLQDPSSLAPRSFLTVSEHELKQAMPPTNNQAVPASASALKRTRRARNGELFPPLLTILSATSVTTETISDKNDTESL